MWANLGLAIGLSAGGFGLWQLITFRRRILELLADRPPSEGFFPPTVATHDDGPDCPGEDEDFAAHEDIRPWPASAPNWNKLPNGE